MKKLFDEKFYNSILSKFPDLKSDYNDIIAYGRKAISTIIKNEINKKSFEDECWLEALADSDGNEKKAVSKYIKIRFDDLLSQFEADLLRIKNNIENKAPFEKFNQLKKKLLNEYDININNLKLSSEDKVEYKYFLNELKKITYEYNEENPTVLNVTINHLDRLKSSK